MEKCPRCKLRRLNRSDCGESSLYGSYHEICVACFEAEDQQIEREGTNDLPEVLRSYGPANMLYPGD